MIKLAYINEKDGSNVHDMKTNDVMHQNRKVALQKISSTWDVSAHNK